MNDRRDKTLESGNPIEQKDEIIAQLEGRLTRLQNEFYEERFIWIVICIVLVDAFIFVHTNNWTGPVVIGIIELLGIYVSAKYLKVDSVAPFIDKLTGFIHRTVKTGKD